MFPGAACVVALVDRFAQHCHRVEILGESWRDKHRIDPDRPPVGGSCARNTFVWTAGEQEFWIWSHKTSAGLLRSKSVTGVAVFYDGADIGHRGVRVTLANGDHEIAAEEHDPWRTRTDRVALSGPVARDRPDRVPTTSQRRTATTSSRGRGSGNT